MAPVLTRAACFVALILMGYILRQIGFFEKKDFELLSKIVIRITLTASIVYSFSMRELDYSLLVLTFMGLGFGAVMILTGGLLARRKSPEDRAFAMLNSSGCNIGNFVLPFAQSFLGAEGVLAASLFDVGNGFITMGGAYSIADSVRQSSKRFSLRPVLLTLRKSVPLWAYLIMTFLGICRLRLPGPIVEYAGIISNANAFLAMLMLGVGFHLEKNANETRTVLRILVPRYLIGALMAICSYWFLPFSLVCRKTLAVLFLSPIASAAPGFTADMRGDYELASAINSLSILISIPLITLVLLM